MKGNTIAVCGKEYSAKIRDFTIGEFSTEWGIFFIGRLVQYKGPDLSMKDKIGRITQISCISRARTNDEHTTKYRVQVCFGSYFNYPVTYSVNFPFIHARMEEKKVD